ncbi:glycerophosphodiester phosphodiesterase family protein [Salinisphaera sp. Q1T1-3]|uniref:glycerophosphodiester phosphodiesterase n=1 Tax=Salinisphaera sp. Q1T1-3 TaxID=2321229 RepID=UPI00131402F8|nr:glycerophosphodiester phosphodiesterase family protein [Salinisphaera sp. Q1T1-3]
MKPWLEDLLTSACETVLAAWPRRAPTRAQLERAVIVAHRGERDGVAVKENTFAAFDPVIAAGVGALEFDVRYTRDAEPVISHDATLKRVFGLDRAIADMDWATLRARVPAVPHLDEMLARYARRATLMIELKERGSARGETRLHTALSDLTPARDFYFLSLEPALFAACGDEPEAARIPVAKTNWARMRDWTLTHDCGGIAGPFVFIGRRDIARLTAESAFIGSGFIRRRGLLMREIGRDIPWLFTNRPLALQRMLDQARRRRA